MGGAWSVPHESARKHVMLSCNHQYMADSIVEIIFNNDSYINVGIRGNNFSKFSDFI